MSGGSWHWCWAYSLFFFPFFPKDKKNYKLWKYKVYLRSLWLPFLLLCQVLVYSHVTSADCYCRWYSRILLCNPCWLELLSGQAGLKLVAILLPQPPNLCGFNLTQINVCFQSLFWGLKANIYCILLLIIYLLDTGAEVSRLFVNLTKNWTMFNWCQRLGIPLDLCLFLSCCLWGSLRTTYQMTLSFFRLFQL